MMNTVMMTIITITGISNIKSSIIYPLLLPLCQITYFACDASSSSLEMSR